MKLGILHPILVVAVMLTSCIVVVYIMFAFVKYDTSPSTDIIQATPKYHYSKIQLREA